MRLADTTTVCDGGATLLGAETGRVLYLRPPAARRIVDGHLEVTDDTSALLARMLLDHDLADPVWRAARDEAAVSGPDDAAVRKVDDAFDDAVLGDVTVVVPVRDRPAQLARLLAALPAGLPVVVVDDGSTDPGAIATAAERHGARLARHPTSRGPAAARNTGAGLADTAYVAFVDSDVVPEPGWLAILRRHLDDPLVGLAAPRVLGLPGTAGGGWLERYEAARSSLDLGPRPARVHPGGPVSYLPSAAMLVRRELWGEGFAEELAVGEDVDLVWRAHDAGWQIRYEPSAVVRHEHRTDVSRWLARKAFYGTGADLLAARHGARAAPLTLTPWSLALVGALLAQRRWSIPLAVLLYAARTLTLSRRLRLSRRPVLTAATVLSVEAIGGPWRTASALLRVYWPLALGAALVSRRASRALVVAAVVDGLLDHRRVHPDLDPVRYLAARRLDDVAYGTGVWVGAWRGRSLRALRPRLHRGSLG